MVGCDLCNQYQGLTLQFGTSAYGILTLGQKVLWKVEAKGFPHEQRCVFWALQKELMANLPAPCSVEDCTPPHTVKAPFLLA